MDLAAINDAKGGLWLLSLILLAAFVLLGRRIGRNAPLSIDRFAPALFGKATRLAAAFTLTGYATFIAAAIAAAGVVVTFRHSGSRAAAGVIVAQLASQALVRLSKRFFGRARPSEWLFRQEIDFSYPSGHAVTAVAFYGGWLAVAALSPLAAALKVALCLALSLWIAGIAWSRIVLGAHHPSDVLGGALLGGAFLCAQLAVLH